MSRVLAVDDSPTLLGMLSACLRSGGHEVITAENGQQALDQLRRHAPDIVITDLNMPVMSGLDFIEAARGEAAGRGVPMFLLTTETAPELRERSRAVRATGWIPKPFDAGHILALVRQLA